MWEKDCNRKVKQRGLLLNRNKFYCSAGSRAGCHMNSSGIFPIQFQMSRQISLMIPKQSNLVPSIGWKSNFGFIGKSNFEFTVFAESSFDQTIMGLNIVYRMNPFAIAFRLQEEETLSLTQLQRLGRRRRVLLSLRLRLPARLGLLSLPALLLRQAALLSLPEACCASTPSSGLGGCGSVRFTFLLLGLTVGAPQHGSLWSWLMLFC